MEPIGDIDFARQLEREQRIEVARLVVAQWDIHATDECAAVVGSSARGWFDDTSDVDVAIVSPFPNRAELEDRYSRSQVSVTYVARSKIEALCSSRYTDLEGLRLLSNMSAGITVAGNDYIVAAAAQANTRAALKPEICDFYLRIAQSRSTCLLDIKGTERLSWLNEGLQAALLLLCALSPLRLLKLKWTMRTIESFAPEAARACELLFAALNCSTAYRKQKAALVDQAFQDDSRAIRHICRQLAAVGRAKSLPLTTTDHLQLCLVSELCRTSGHFDQLAADIDWPAIDKLLAEITRMAVRRVEVAMNDDNPELLAR
ncbi:nucleotidyltransferase domain-containing protein [Mesorhizobium sp. M0243]|uniref:nucleotidyltransferase domain-containing protein n=1 Tax=Mesorhizobium sp. M0243 TaxID=2956925 RepID=UPI00333D41A1